MTMMAVDNYDNNGKKDHGVRGIISIQRKMAIADQMDMLHMTHSQMLGKVECGGGPIFKVVLEC